MDLTYCNVNYRTEAFDDTSAGCAGLHLFATANDETVQVGKIVFWDAAGQFFIELNAAELSLHLVERFIAEAKQAIPIK